MTKKAGTANGVSAAGEMRSLLSRFRGLKALVVGDAMLDHYVWGDATRLSPEAPVPVVQIARDSFVAGGAANVAANVRALGARVELWAAIGRDQAGVQLRRLLREEGIGYPDRHLATRGPTTQKTRVMVQRQQLCRLDRESVVPELPRNRAARLRPLLRTVRDFDVVILSDYAKGFLDAELVAEITRRAHAAGRLVTLDPKPRRPLPCHDLDLLTPNRREAVQLAGLHPDDAASFSPANVCRVIWRRYRPRHLVITLGEDGMLLSERGRVLRCIPTVAREVFDVSGAGDTVVAALSLALAAGASLEDAAHLANAAAGVVVGKIGTATATPAEIMTGVAAP